VQLDDRAVEREAPGREDRLAEADAAGIAVDDLAVGEQLDVDGVEVRVPKVPEGDGAELF